MSEGGFGFCDTVKRNRREEEGKKERKEGRKKERSRV